MTNTVLSTIGIDSLVGLIAEAVVKKMSKLPEPNQEQIFGIDGASELTGLSKQTIYNKVAKREIPHQRKGGRLYFSSTELTDWLKEGKRMTNSEIKSQASNYTSKNK